MKKNAFTLAELIGVVVLLAAIALLVIPNVAKQLKDGKQKLYNNQIELIKQSLEFWANENYRPKNNETVYLTLSQLKESSFIDSDITNPLTEDYFANDMILTISNVNNIVSYDILEMGQNKSKYSEIPKITMNGNLITKLEINDVYVEPGVTATIDGVNIEDISIYESNDETNCMMSCNLGSYYIKYTASYNGKSNSVIRTIIVNDTVSPVISFEGDLRISLSEINTYDFTSDVVVTDNSSDSIDVQVQKNLTNLKGTYTIKYIAKDASGNVSTKVRNVVVY